MAAKGTALEAAKTLSASDRAALRTIVKERFKVIRKGLTAREQQAYNVAQSAVNAALQEVTEEARKETARLQKKLDKLNTEYMAIVAKYKAEGIKPSYAERLRIENQWTVAKANELLQSEQNLIWQKVATAREALDKQEQELVESLILGDITEDARTFLARVPTLDALVPLPSPQDMERKLLSR